MNYLFSFAGHYPFRVPEAGNTNIPLTTPVLFPALSGNLNSEIAASSFHETFGGQRTPHYEISTGTEFTHQK